MSEKLLPCPFCQKPLTLGGGVNPYGRCDTPDCWLNERRISISLDVPKQIEQWNRRTPAPKGEAVGTAGAMPGTSGFTTAVFRASAVPVGTPLYASPVVPVEVRRRVLDELDRAWLHGQRRTSWRRDESADAILAILRPIDTGREA